MLGLGNLLLRDDAIGLEILAALRLDAAGRDPVVDLVDGGTQGLALLGVISERPAMVLLDAVANGGTPGTVYVMTGEEALALRFAPAGTAHESGAGALLATLHLLGELPAWVRIVGVEPGIVRTGIGLTPAVEAALPEALRRSRAAVQSMLAVADRLAPPPAPAPATSVAG